MQMALGTPYLSTTLLFNAPSGLAGCLLVDHPFPRR